MILYHYGSVIVLIQNLYNRIFEIGIYIATQNEEKSLTVYMVIKKL